MNNGRYDDLRGVRRGAENAGGGWTRVAEQEIGDLGNKAESEPQPQSWSAPSEQTAALYLDYELRQVNPAIAHQLCVPLGQLAA